ncbi:MAG: hypothetical protein WBD34_06700, partial [Burkholderiaceae bacterium]
MNVSNMQFAELGWRDRQSFDSEKQLIRKTFSVRARCRVNIRFGKIVSFEEKGFSGGLGECVGKTIAKVQRGRVAAFSKVCIGLARQPGLL